VLRYRVFTPTSRGDIHYGSGREGVAATSVALGAGSRELAMISEAHGLCVGSLIHIDNRWVRITALREAPVGCLPEVEWRYLPPYEMPGLLYGSDHWSPEMIKRLTAEAIGMESRE